MQPYQTQLAQVQAFLMALQDQICPAQAWLTVLLSVISEAALPS